MSPAPGTKGACDLDGFKPLRNFVQESLRHTILADLARSVSAEVARTVQIEFPPPTGKRASTVDLRMSITFVGEVDAEQKLKIDEVLRKYSTASRLGG